LLWTRVAADVGNGLERAEQSMAEPARRAPTRAAVPGRAGHRDAEIYDRHAAAVYGQALLMLADEALAGQVARDVIVAECALPAASPRVTARVSARLAVSTLRRCQELLAGRPREERAARGRHARGGSVPPGPDGRTQALLGLVLFGRMEYREAADELAISPSRAAALLREALAAPGAAPGSRPVREPAHEA